MNRKAGRATNTSAGLKAENEADGNVQATGMQFLFPDRGLKERQLPSNLSEMDIEALPDKPGVYYFLDAEGRVIYVGKAKNLHKRVISHFSVHNPSQQRQNFMQEVCAITYERCGTELMAFILEVLEIKRIMPKYNHALKNYESKFGLFCDVDLSGHHRMKIAKYNKNLSPIQVFTTRQGGMDKLQELAQRFGLCASLCNLTTCGRCDVIDKRKDLLCTANLPIDEYNAKVAQALSFLKAETPGFYIIGQGRHRDEKSCIWVEQGCFYGMGYIDNSADIGSLEDVRDSLNRYESNHYIMQLVISYMCKYPGKVFKLEM